jgi:hypothetical protein
MLRARTGTRPGVTPASDETLNSALTGGVSQNHFRKLNDQGS